MTWHEPDSHKEKPTPLDLFPIEFDHELHVSNPFRQLFRLPVAIGDERLKLTEGYTRRAANKHQWLFFADVCFSLFPMRGDIEVPAPG